MVTFSPELKLHLARMVSTSADKVRMEHIRRPVLIAEGEEDGGMNGMQEVEGIIEWLDLSKEPGKYRIVGSSS